MFSTADKSVQPVPLLMLLPEEIRTLRPFDIHNGDYVRMPEGYQKKTRYFHISISQLSVTQTIANLDNDDSRTRCEAAYDYLMSSNASSYSECIALCQQLVNDQKQLNILDFRVMEGIECALWPHLHPYTSWCESALYGGEDRKSAKVSFMTK